MLSSLHMLANVFLKLALWLSGYHAASFSTTWAISCKIKHVSSLLFELTMEGQKYMSRNCVSTSQPGERTLLFNSSIMLHLYVIRRIQGFAIAAMLMFGPVLIVKDFVSLL